MMGVTEKLNIYKMIREAVFFLAVMSSLHGCGGLETDWSMYPWQEKKEQILDWSIAEKAKVDNGTLKDSDYWKQFYQKSIELRPDLDDFLHFAVEMIKVSRIFEEGKITKEQFEDKQDQLFALLAQEEDRRDQVLAPLLGKNYEAILFTCYRESLFLAYINDLRSQLNAAGPRLSSSHCDFFDDSIQCTDQDPFF